MFMNVVSFLILFIFYRKVDVMLVMSWVIREGIDVSIRGLSWIEVYGYCFFVNRRILVVDECCNRGKDIVENEVVDLWDFESLV